MNPRESYPFAMNPIQIPNWGETQIVDENLAWLMGAWDGDGTIRPYGVGFTGNIKETTLEGLLKSSLERVFNSGVHLYHYRSRPGSFDMEAGGLAFKKWFEQLASPRGETVPDVILQSPRSVVCAYLQGLFDTDGYINNIGIVGVSSKSELFLRQIQLLLSDLGLDTHLGSHTGFLAKTGKHYIGWNLRIRGWESKKIFAKDIGFREPWKQQRLEECLNNPPKRKQTDTKLPVIDLVSGLVKEYIPHRFVKEHGVRQGVFAKIREGEKKGVIAEDTARYVRDTLVKLGVQDPRLTTLSSILDEMVIRQVVEVEPAGFAPVFDIEVEGDHEYQSGMFLSHNCERSSDIVTASWIDSDLVKSNRVQFQCLKSRDQKPFEIFLGRVEWPCRRVLTCFDVVMDDRQKDAVGANLDADLLKLDI